MTVNKFIKESNNFSVRPLVHCNDGFTISIQASKFHYCSPRTDTDQYTAVEIGYPSDPEQSIAKYAENPSNDLTDNVYGWVPVDLVEKIIEKHGGINIQKTFKKKA
jgi:hypothetical protein